MQKELSNIDVALFALYKLGGTAKKIHTEDIAWEASQLARERFSWRLPKFRERGFIDKTPVRHALEQAKKKEYGKLVSGQAGGDINRPQLEGWRFTAQGVEWINKNESRIAKALKQKAPDLPKREAEHFMRRLKAEPCFKHFQQKGSLEGVSSYMFTDMLGCAPDASKDIVRQKYERLLRTAKLAKDTDILQFLEVCNKAFSELIES